MSVKNFLMIMSSVWLCPSINFVYRRFYVSRHIYILILAELTFRFMLFLHAFLF